MKAGRPHRVPLCEPALAILAELPRIVDCPIIFPGYRPEKPLRIWRCWN